jgi:hypothetical protein
MEPTPLKEFRHKKGWRLNRVESELIKRKIPISWPTLIKIDNGYKSVIIKNTDGTMQRKKAKYNPSNKNLKKLAKLTGINYKNIYVHKHT